MAPSRDRRPGFSRRAQNSLFVGYVLAIAGLIVGVVLLAVSYADPRAFGSMRSGVREVTTPVSSALVSVETSVAGLPEAVGSFFHVRSENVQLRAELVAANRLLTRARTLRYDNTRLRRLLALREGAGDVVAAARLVSSSASSTRRFAVLNAGVWQGVREDQPVEGPDGLVGRTLEVGPNTARVLMLTDPESVVPVRRTRDGQPAIVAGRGDGQVDIRSVNQAFGDFRPGDLFVTSGIGGIYAPGIPVARVLMRNNDGALGQTVADPNTLDIALVRRAFMPPPPPSRDARP